MTLAATPKNVLLITPPYHYGLADVLGSWVPLNLVYLAGAAREAGFSVEIYDALNKKHGYPEIEAHLCRAAADVVAVSACTATVNEALKTLELARKLNPAVVTVMGGVHASYLYREVLEQNPAVDYVVIGEGEASFAELLCALRDGADCSQVAGIALRNGQEVVRTRVRPLEADLDRLATAWDLVDWPDYTYNVMPGSRLGAVSTSRGCEHDCTFCSQREFWQHCWRGRDPQRVVEELACVHRRFGVTLFQVSDEHPTRDAARWEALLDLLIERGLPIQFLMETRPGDLVRDREILGKYRLAGIIHVSIGAESREQARLDQMKKGLELGEVRQAVELLRQHGIVSELSFVLGHPDETPQSVAQTLKLAQDINPDSANFLALTPWPYSELYRELGGYLRETDYARYNLIDPVLEPEQMTLLQLELSLVDCFRKFYMGKVMEVMLMKDEFRRGYMVRATKIIMASPFVFKKFGQLVMGRVPEKLGEMMQKKKG
jgi:anaerobic magnesium-protoporphyrin IX monomethyl ester cyclase